jgi:hypothetical protein
MSRLAAAGAALAFLLAAILWGVPYLTHDRTAYTGTPTPPAFAEITPVALKPGRAACQDGVALESATRVVRVLASKQRVGVPLRVTASGDGWRAEGRSPRDYGGTDPIDTTIAAPPRSLLARVCVENAGRRTVRLQGTVEARVQPRPLTTVDGKLVQPRMTLILLEERPASITDRAGAILAHVSAFKPPIVGSVSVALLLALLLAGVPAAAVYALWRSLRDDETSA